MNFEDMPNSAYAAYLQSKKAEEERKSNDQYTTLLSEGRLNEHLHAIDIQAHELLDDIIPRLAQERGIDEVLKAHNPLQWVAEMNNIKASAEEVVLREVVYQ